MCDSWLFPFPWLPSTRRPWGLAEAVPRKITQVFDSSNTMKVKGDMCPLQKKTLPENLLVCYLLPLSLDSAESPVLGVEWTRKSTGLEGFLNKLSTTLPLSHSMPQFPCL